MASDWALELVRLAGITSRAVACMGHQDFYPPPIKVFFNLTCNNESKFLYN
jgi:hypothetical protein